MDKSSRFSQPTRRFSYAYYAYQVFWKIENLDDGECRQRFSKHLVW